MTAFADDDEQRDLADAEEREDDGPDVAELSEDPAYEPDEEGLKDIKGG
jgi:hypothetical protein